MRINAAESSFSDFMILNRFCFKKPQKLHSEAVSRNKKGNDSFKQKMVGKQHGEKRQNDFAFFWKYLFRAQRLGKTLFGFCLFFVVVGIVKLPKSLLVLSRLPDRGFFQKDTHTEFLFGGVGI